MPENIEFAEDIIENDYDSRQNDLRVMNAGDSQKAYRIKMQQRKTQPKGKLFKKER